MYIFHFSKGKARWLECTELKSAHPDLKRQTCTGSAELTQSAATGMGSFSARGLLPTGPKIIAMNHTPGCDPLYLPFLLDETPHFLLQDGLFNIPVQEGFIFGYGLGIRIETGLGMFGVSYALGKGDSILEGKVHFGLINDF